MSSNIKASIIIRLSLLIFIVVSANSCNRDEPTVYTVAILYDNSSNSGRSLKNTGEMVANEFKNDIRFKKSKVKFIFKDIGSTQEAALETFHKLIKEQNIIAIVGPTTSHLSLPIASSANALKIPMITPSASNEEVTKNKPFVFTAAFNTETQAKALVKFVTEDLKVKNIGVLYDASNTYNQKTANQFRELINREPSVKIVSRSYTKVEKNFYNYLEELRIKNVELLFLPNFDKDINLQTEQLKKMQWSPIILGSDSWYPKKYIERKVFNRTYFSHQWDISISEKNSQAREFIKKHKAQFNNEPTIINALSYDAFNLLFLALFSESSEKLELHQKLSRINLYRGVSGNYSFIQSNIPNKPVYLFEVKEGRVKLYREIDNE